ncbi:AAA family ATPase [Bifidobacterium saguinibicoloris]|uniref:AAA family ATPase n=1 Tax=Bifidobacterium saguinibicoloris TaxID=2834433 RepID=UPI001C55C68D|nr:AAA family ATPase [Bifidobacterium saguinibicoloris]MBW3081739.1 AAA family ATPase [Bifidobacterium saguinibicoloris]
MPEQKEFHELFTQTNGRIFALLISTDGRGHFDSRGRLALDYCAAGQTFDLPKGMFDSDEYRDTDVVLTFAKLEHDGEYLLVDAHSAKEPTIDISNTTTSNNKKTGRSGHISFENTITRLEKLFSDYQNRLTISIHRPNIATYPSLQNYSDIFYAECNPKGRSTNSYNNSKIREKLFSIKLEQLYPNSKTSYINAVKDIKYTSLVGNNKKPISSYQLPKFDTIFDLIDSDTLLQIRSDWIGARTLYKSPTEKSPEVTAGYAARDLDLYAEFLKSSPINDLSRNLIYFGAPGTGKSYRLNEDLKQFDGRYERVTFYSDYLHAQFVGSFRPKALAREQGEADFTYAFTPGPFTRVLIDALNDQDSEQDHVLVIEEINRADPASVFGDIFQLLDRNDDGNSTYPITVSEDMKAYLWSEDGLDEHGRQRLAEITGQHYNATGEAPKSLSIALPSNMLIWATMNSADQGVYPMDTAFKRRWSFRYVGINDGAEAIKDTKWRDWRNKINTLLLTKAKVPEDKLLGPFFLGSPNLTTGTDEFNEAFKNKVIMYLFEDAARYKRTEIFDEKEVGDANGSPLTLSDLFTAWDKKQFAIFK